MINGDKKEKDVRLGYALGAMVFLVARFVESDDETTSETVRGKTRKTTIREP